MCIIPTDNDIKFDPCELSLRVTQIAIDILSFVHNIPSVNYCGKYINTATARITEYKMIINENYSTNCIYVYNLC